MIVDLNVFLSCTLAEDVTVWCGVHAIRTKQSRYNIDAIQMLLLAVGQAIQATYRTAAQWGANLIIDL